MHLVQKRVVGQGRQEHIAPTCESTAKKGRGGQWDVARLRARPELSKEHDAHMSTLYHERSERT